MAWYKMVQFFMQTCYIHLFYVFFEGIYGSIVPEVHVICLYICNL